MQQESGEPAPLRSPQLLRSAFERGLVRLLDEQGLGPFILACANATAEPALYDRLCERLARRMDALSAADEQGDDAVVFAQLAALGFANLSRAERRRAGRFEVQFNQLRSFRPLRGGGRAVGSIHAPFDEGGFHFNRPFLRKEVLWAGDLLGRPVSLLYNKFPFVELHGLLVPEPARQLPQYLDEERHRYIWALTESLGGELPGLGFGYNAYGAFSSVNHLHFHLFVRDEPLPVEDGGWLHNGGAEAYPCDCVVHTDADEAWRHLAALHHGDIAYNLLYRPGRLYCLPRRKQGSYRHSAWTGGYAWYEMAGGVVTFGRADYEGLDEAAIARELACVALAGPGGIEP